MTEKTVIKVLIVDDKPENLYLLRVLLGAKGYEVSEAANGEQGLESARNNPPDLIISDILMPVMDGFALCRVWKTDVQLKIIPFIFYTATYTEPKDKAFSLSLGADLFLVKPQESHVLLNEIDTILAMGHQQSLPKTSPAELGEEDFYRQYNVRLVHKLEDKLEEIEQKNRALVEKELALYDLNAQLEKRVAQRTQELEAVNKEMEAFNYSVSHDLRAPLRRVDGFSQILMEDCAEQLGEEGQGNLQRIRKAVRHMDELIDGMLELSRLNHEKLNRETINLSVLAEAEIMKLRETDPDWKAEIFIQPDVVADGDPRLLGIVFDNLLGNALKFTAKTEQARIAFGVTVQNGETVYYIEDNGAGFEMQYVDKLFGAFQRLHNVDDFPGSGIGLASVARSIHRHGGRVWAEGETDKGATFYFTL
ncbi:MAG: response regulator [Ectothiorhodospiraceae bacterium]|nr:response regulator [Ectothiorhodospiraceae bacterium]